MLVKHFELHFMHKKRYTNKLLLLNVPFKEPHLYKQRLSSLLV